VSYGVDTYCYDRPITGRLASGTELLAQACYRRLTTPRGLLDDGDEGVVYGFDLLEQLGRNTPDDAAELLPAGVVAELSKDDRIASVSATADVVLGKDGLDTINLAVVVVPFDESTNAFTLTLAVSAVGVAVLGVTEAS
jgi:hypothetical protein